jgi:hypothetical protein
MGYRDDLYALETRCQVLDQDLRPRREELRRLEARGVELAAEIRRRRWRLRLRRALGWARRHWLFTALVLLATGVPGCITAYNRVERFWMELHSARRMDALGCHAVLEVSSLPPGASVFAGSHRLGETPLRERICPGHYLIRVQHARSLPWQRTIEAPRVGRVSLESSLIPWRPTQRPPGGSVIFSEPAGAIVFVDGKEAGRTPVFVADGARGSRRVALAAPDHHPIVLRPRPRSALWFTLAPTRRPEDAGRPR